MPLTVAKPAAQPTLGVTGSSGQSGGLTTAAPNGSAGLNGGYTGIPAGGGGTAIQVNPANTDTSGYNLGGSTGGGGGAAAAAAQAAAAQAAKVAQLRDTITSLAQGVLGVYNGLYGNIDQAGADQGAQVNKKYDLEGTGLVNQFNQDFPTIGNSYSSRGAYDSSYRQDAEHNAAQSLSDQQDQLGIGRNQDLAKVGQFVAQNKAGLDQNKGGINVILDHIGQTDDPNELTTIQNAIQQKLLDAQSQSAQLGTQGGYVGQLQGIVPTADQTASITANLHSIIQGEANPMLKKSVGAKLIQTSGLPDSQKQQLIASFNDTVDKQQQG